MATVFFFKENDTNDRDCVRYINEAAIQRGYISVCGACFFGKFGNPSYEDITTILTEQEFNTLWNARDYDAATMDSIMDKLRSEDNIELFKKVREEEIEWVMDEYSLDYDEADEVFNDYGGYYQDRAILGGIFEDTYNLGYEEAYSLGYVGGNNDYIVEHYFDFEKFGEDLLNDGDYYELNDGRIISMNY